MKTVSNWVELGEYTKAEFVRVFQALRDLADLAESIESMQERIAALEADNAELRRRIGLPETRKE